MNSQTIILIIIIIILVIIQIIFVLRSFQNSDKGEVKRQNKLLLELLETKLDGQNKLITQSSNLQSQTVKEQIIRIDQNMLQTNHQISQIIKAMFADFDSKQVSLAKQFDNKNIEFEKRLATLATLDQSLNNLQERIGTLSMILGNTKARGTFGEIQMYQLIDNQFGVQNQSIKKQDKLNSGVIADLSILSNSLGQKICIDSKFPLENYLEYLETAEIGFKNLFERDIKKHIDAIKSKYIIGGETVNFAIMFIPSEAIYLEVMENSKLVDYSYKRNVWIASPTTLIALITMLENINTDYKRNENLAETHAELDKLSLEFERFNKRYNNLSKHMSQIINDFEDISITQNKLVMRFESIKKMEMKGNEDEQSEG